MEDATTTVPTTATEPTPVTESNDNGAPVETPASTETTETPAAEAPVVMSDYEKHFQAVTKNPLDFTTWSYLLAAADKESDVEKGRKAYDSFLVEFPLCFGYWNKYAELEQRQGVATDSKEAANPDAADVDSKARAVFERGVVAVRHSIEMWTNYFNYLVSKGFDDDARSVMKRAVEAVGNDTKSSDLYEKWLAFEKEKGTPATTVEVYNAVLRAPLTTLDSSWWPRYSTFASQATPEVLAGAEELQQLEEAVRNEMMAGPEGGEPPAISTVEMVASMKKKIVEVRQASKQAVMEEVTKRMSFEAQVKRSYFHVKPVKESELVNWRNYLSFERKAHEAVVEAEGSSDEAKEAARGRVEKLFERCMVACANYSEFWFLYADWVRSTSDAAASLSILRRAADVFLKNRPDVHLRLAALLEEQGEVEDARGVYVKLSELCPGLLEAILARVNFERRAGSVKAATAVYEQELEASKEREGADEASMVFLYMHYARFCAQVSCNEKGAEAAYEAGLALYPANKDLWLAFLNFSITRCGAKTKAGGGQREERVCGVFERMVGEESKLEGEAKADIWVRYQEFMEDFSVSLTAVNEVVARRKAFEKANAAAVAAAGSKKRPLDAAAAAVGGAAKQARSDGYNANAYGGGYHAAHQQQQQHAQAYPQQQQYQQAAYGGADQYAAYGQQQQQQYGAAAGADPYAQQYAQQGGYYQQQGYPQR